MCSRPLHILFGAYIATARKIQRRLKTFLREEDKNAEELLREYPAGEPGSYIHPKIGVPEHVFWENEIITELDPYFTVHKVLKSHRHLSHGRAFKRRSISIYAQKK